VTVHKRRPHKITKNRPLSYVSGRMSVLPQSLLICADTAKFSKNLKFFEKSSDIRIWRIPNSAKCSR